MAKIKYNRKKFFDGFRAFLRSVDKELNQSRVNALEFLLSQYERDPHWKDDRHTGYSIATICIETAWTFEPIQEYGSYSYFERRYGSQTRKGRELGNDAKGEGAKYSGKGYVQLTGESNYEKLEAELRKEYPELIREFEQRTGQEFDLSEYSNQAKDPQLAFAIMTIGMFKGIYTGKKFSDYINATKTDNVGARRIINGQDRASEIAGFARTITKILKDSAAVQNSVRVMPSEKPSVDTSKQEPTEEIEQPPETNQAVETSQTATVETDNKTVEQTVETKNEQDVNKTEEVHEPPKYNEIGFIATIKRDLAAIGIGNGVFQTAAEYAEKANSLPQWAISLILKLAYIVVAISIIWLLYRGIHYVVDSWKKAQRVKLQAEINTDITRKNMVYVPGDWQKDSDEAKVKQKDLQIWNESDAEVKA